MIDNIQSASLSRLSKLEEFCSIIHNEVITLTTKMEKRDNEPRLMFGQALEDMEQKMIQIYNLLMLDHGRVDIVNVINEGLRQTVIKLQTQLFEVDAKMQFNESHLTAAAALPMLTTSHGGPFKASKPTNLNQSFNFKSSTSL